MAKHSIFLPSKEYSELLDISLAGMRSEMR